MKIKHLLLILFYILACNATYAQMTNGTTHLTYNKKYDLCLPQLETAITVPAFIGFQPIFESQDKSLKRLRTDYATCFFDTTLIDSDYYNYISFEFGSGPNREYLYFHILRKDKSLTSQSISQKKGFSNFATPITTKLGKTVGYTLAKGSNRSTTHIVEHGDYRYEFLYSPNYKPATIKKIEGMIKSFAVKKMPDEIRLYDNREDLKELKKDIENTKAVINYNELQEYKDRTISDATFTIDEAGISIQMPKGTDYILSGTEFEHKNNNYHIKAETIDPAERINMYTLYHNDASVMIKVYYGEEEVPEWLNGMLSGDFYNFSEKITLNLDGITLPATVEGNKDRDFLTNLNTYYIYENKLVWLTFSALSEKNEDTYNKILSSIKLNIPDKKGATEARPLSAAFKFNKLKAIEINKNIKFPKVESTQTRMNIPQLKLEFDILGDFDEYKILVNYKDAEPLETKTINQIPQNIDDDLTIQFYENNSGMNYSLVKVHNERVLSLEEEIIMYTRSYSAYKGYKIIQTGLANYNNLEWAVLITETSGRFTASMHTYIEDYKFTVYIYGDNLKDIMKRVGVLETFELKN